MSFAIQNSLGPLTYQIQTDAFLDECETIFQQFLNEDLASALIHDPENNEWSTHQLDEKLKSHLGERFVRFENVLNDIHKHINALQESLDAFSGDVHRPDVKVSL